MADISALPMTALLVCGVLGMTRRWGGPFIGYLRALEEFDRLFPGFEHDLHSVDHVGGDYVISCVADS